MKVFIFDLLAYGKHFDQYKQTKYLPYPLANDHYDREVAAQTYEQHLKAWEEMDKLGFDGGGLNEHHTTPHGMMNSPNMMAAVAAQRTKKLKFLMLGNLVPLHNPLRIAEELAMASRGEKPVPAALASYVARRQRRVETIVRLSRQVGEEGQRSGRLACWLRNRRVRRAGRVPARTEAALERLLAWPPRGEARP